MSNVCFFIVLTSYLRTGQYKVTMYIIKLPFANPTVNIRLDAFAVISVWTYTYCGFNHCKASLNKLSGNVRKDHMKLKSKSTITIAILLGLLLGVFAFGGNVSAATELEETQQVQFQAPLMVVNASFLNIRTGPGAQYTVLITVVGGTELPVLGVARDLVWYQVSTVAGIGWVNSNFALPRGNFQNVPFVQAPEVTSVQPSAFGTTPGSSDAVATVGFSTGRAWGLSVTIAHPLRTRPTMNSSSLGSVGGNVNVIYSLFEAAQGDGIVWYRIDTPDLGTGWVEAEKTMFRPFGCGDISIAIFNTSLAPTIGPNGSGSLDGNVRLPEGSEVYLIDAINNFYFVELQDGSNGWIPAEAVSIRDESVISADFCTNGGVGSVMATTTTTTTDGTTTTTTTTQPQLSGPRVVINTGFLNLRSGPGSQYSIVSTVSGGTELRVIGFAPDGVWYLVEGSFGQAWLNSEFTLFRGNGAGVPIIREFTASILSTPVAAITNAVTLFSSPNGTNVIGALSGPLNVNIVARTADFNWVQVSTQIGFGWVQTSLISLQGDSSLIPVIGG